MFCVSNPIQCQLVSRPTRSDSIFQLTWTKLFTLSRWVILQSRPRGSFVNGKTKANIVVLFNLIYLIIRHETSKRISPLCQLLIRKKAFFIRLPLKRKIVPICQLCLKAGQNKFQHQTAIKLSFLSKTFSASLSKLLPNAHLLGVLY